MEFIQNITIGQFAAFVLFVGGLYGGVKYLKKELKDAIVEMLKDQFKDVEDKLTSDNKRIKELESHLDFILRAISLLLQDDVAILEHLRTSNNTGKMSEQEEKVMDFLTEVKL